MAAIHALSLTEVVRRTTSGELAVREVAEAMVDRIRRLDGEYGAYQLALGSAALARADALDAAQRRGAKLGILHGAPIALKDLLDTKDIPTAGGTTVWAQRRPAFDATVVRRLANAGALVLGKTKLTEGAYALHHPAIAPPKNPWNPARWTGVSSSGSGVAVAAGLAHGAIGSDTGGSIRFPSASCGLVGVKPTYGRVSRYGVMPLAESLDHLGPMTRSVADARRMLAAMSGADEKDPTSHGPPAHCDSAPFDNLRGLIVAVDEEYAGTASDPDAGAAIDAAVRFCRDAGAAIRPLRLPSSAALVEGWGTTCGVECAIAHADAYRRQPEAYGPALASLIEAGRRASAMDYARLERERERFRAGLNAILAEADLLLAPCMPGPVPAAERSADFGHRDGFIRFTAPFDYSGHPSVTLPFAVDEDNVPRAYQLIGRRMDDDRLLAIAERIEAAAGFGYPHLA